MRITVSMPCWVRPQRTLRAIENICAQTINGWEALVVGDGCPEMQKMLCSGVFTDMVGEAAKKGNRLSITNAPVHKGGCGYDIINANIQKAIGKYFLFLSNDDVILPNHFENYLSGIENTDLDFAYFNTYIEPCQKIRDAELKEGSIGHSELIIRTEFLRQMPPHDCDYGHDFRMIRNMINAGAKNKKITGVPETYIVKGVGDLRQDIID